MRAIPAKRQASAQPHRHHAGKGPSGELRTTQSLTLRLRRAGLPKTRRSAGEAARRPISSVAAAIPPKYSSGIAIFAEA